MAIENYGLREMILTAVDDDITVYLHTADPGSAGTTSRVASASIGSATITATSGWTIHATQGHAEAASDISFGVALAAVTGVTWVSMFKGTNFYARRVLQSSMDVAIGSTVSVTASSIVLEVTSTDS